MNLAIAVTAGVLVALAVVCVRFAVRPPHPRPRRARPGRGRREAQRAALASGVGLVVLLVSGWLVAAVAVWALVWFHDRIFTAAGARGERQRLEGIKKWLEDLRDVLKPGTMSLEQALEQTARTAPAVIGGELARFDQARRQGVPVEDALIALARLKGPVEGSWSQVTDGLGSIDMMLDPDDVADGVLALRVFRGYSGWGAQQLDDELADGAWMVLPAELADVFCEHPSDLWRTVLRRQGGRIAWVANAPDDLSAN